MGVQLVLHQCCWRGVFTLKKVYIKFLVLFVVLACTMVPAVYAVDSGSCSGTVSAAVNFRKTPNTFSEIISVLPSSTVVTVLGYDPVGTDWWKISYGGQIGYVTFSSLVVEHFDLSVVYSGLSGEPFDCEAGGWKTYFCSCCSYELVEKVRPADHLIRDESYFSNKCDEDSYIRQYCEICDWEVNEVVPAPGHELNVYYCGKSLDDPFDCNEGGYKITECLRDTCSYTLTEEISAGHAYQEVARIEPTYNSTGSSTMECSICGYQECVEIPALIDYGMSGDFFLLGQAFMSGTWKLFQVYVPGMNFTFGGMLIGIALVSISLSVLQLLFGIGHRGGGTSARTSSTNNAKISKERERDEY